MRMRDYFGLLAILFLLSGLSQSHAGEIVQHSPRVVESLPHTEQIESGQLTLQQLSDRQLTAFLIDVTNRINYDRQQHNGAAGSDAGYLHDWTARIIQEITSRGMAADEQGAIGRPQGVER